MRWGNEVAVSTRTQNLTDLYELSMGAGIVPILLEYQLQVALLFTQFHRVEVVDLARVGDGQTTELLKGVI